LSGPAVPFDEAGRVEATDATGFVTAFVIKKPTAKPRMIPSAQRRTFFDIQRRGIL
jgi:hypothetical protein